MADAAHRGHLTGRIVKQRGYGMPEPTLRYDPERKPDQIVDYGEMIEYVWEPYVCQAEGCESENERESRTVRAQREAGIPEADIFP